MVVEASTEMKSPNAAENSLKTDDDEEEKEKLNFADEVRDYSEYSTIAGLIYIFMEGQTTFGKAYWTTTVVAMIALGAYWTGVIYSEW
jgi:hypothetical protein